MGSVLCNIVKQICLLIDNIKMLQPSESKWVVMATGDISILLRYPEYMACVSLQTVSCYFYSGKAGASNGVKVGSSPTEIVTLQASFTWSGTMPP